MFHPDSLGPRGEPRTHAVYLLAYLFNSCPNPADPFPTCGPDPTDDLLGCENFGVCP